MKSPEGKGGHDDRRACGICLSLMGKIGVRLKRFGDTGKRLADLGCARGLLAVASLAVFGAHLESEALEPELGVLDFRLSLLPSLLGAGLEVFFQHTRSLGAGFRVLG